MRILLILALLFQEGVAPHHNDKGSYYFFTYRTSDMQGIKIAESEKFWMFVEPVKMPWRLFTRTATLEYGFPERFIKGPITCEYKDLDEPLAPVLADARLDGITFTAKQNHRISFWCRGFMYEDRTKWQ